MALVDEHLLDVLRRRGSDLHLMASEPPRVRVHGELLPLSDIRLSAQQVSQMLLEIIPRRAQERFDAQDNADFAYSIGGRARFRVNILRHLNGLGAVFRAIAGRGVTLAELEMPEAVHNLARLQRGLILVTGKTGSGKSTTLSAIVDDINTRTHGHIITIEDPIEFVHQRKGCLISQREVGLHAPSFAAALRSALREDPDVVLVGELRDLETMSIAVTAAEMGILVLATLHTNGAAQTIDRMINTFPADKQPHVRTMLSTSLRGVISQQLLQRADAAGRIAAMEIMLNTSAVANLIRQDKLEQLESTLQSGAHLGMRTMDSAIATLLEEGRISGREAYAKAQNKARFEATKESG